MAPETPSRADRGELPVPRDYRPLLAVTLWTAGLLLALVFGMVSAYVVVSVIFVGSKMVARLRAGAAGRGETT
jgi:hypothetical protein